MRPNWHSTFMQIAELFADHATCIRKHVGVVLVRDRRIISCGYNGSPSGCVHCEEVFGNPNASWRVPMSHHDFSAKYELHAEQNCLAFASKVGVKIDGDCILYVTYAPCSACAKLIVACGVKTVIYKQLYDKSNDGVELLKTMGIKVCSLEQALREDKNDN